jgi:N-methylhydantoinase B
MRSPKANPPRIPVDPVIFEIIRRRMAAINDEAALTVMRISGSQIVTEAGDLNAVILSADGKVVMSGMYMLVHTCALSGLVNFVVREYMENPGFGPGDMFITNDPYVTGLHQADSVLVAPIYDEGRLIAWCGTTVHESDVGGPVPGSIAVGASSIFDEPIPMAPIKIVEAGITRRDVEREWLIRSRTRELNALDLLGQIAANRVITNRIMELCHRYGTDTVVATLDWLLVSTEARLRERLATLPDGKWSHTGFVEHDGIEDVVYSVTLTMTKEGDQLDLDFTDSSEQAPGLINCPVDLTRAFVVATLMALLGYDGVPWVPSAYEQIATLRTSEGSVTHAKWPAGVSLGGASIGHEVRICITACFSRMLGASAHDSHKVMAGCMSSAPGQTISGIGTDGDHFTSILLDAQPGGGGARTYADGEDTYGLLHSPGGTCANIEVNEFNFPILYLWRAERGDSGGPGRRRGGVGGRHAFVPHHAQGPIRLTAWAHGVEQPPAVGVAGGEPGAHNSFLILRQAMDKMTPDMIGVQPLDLPGRQEVLSPKAQVMVEDGDVVLSFCGGGGGFGDPLERASEEVQVDVENGLVSIEGAQRDYGVIMESHVDGTIVNEEATASLRDRLKEERLDARNSEVDVSRDLSAAGLHREDCSSHGLGPESTETSPSAMVEETGASARWPLAERLSGSSRFVLRRFFCPECAAQLKVEVSLREESNGRSETVLSIR